MKLIRFTMVLGVMAVALTALTASRPVAAQAPATITSPAANLRIQLVALLTQHADMALPVLEKRHDNAPDFAAAAAALDQNSLMVAAMVRAVYGDAAAAQFLQLWRRHIDDYVLYTDGATMQDAATQQQARADLRTFVQEISALLAQANPNLSQPALEQAYQMHVDQTLAAVNAYGVGDYARVYAIAHEAHEHIAMVGTTLAVTIVQQFPQQFAGDPISAAVELRFMMVNLLTEYTALGGLATQKVIDNAPDTDAVIAALEMNAALIGDAVRDVYGDAAATQFLLLWRAHLAGAAEYAKGTMDDGTDGGVLRQTAEQGLTRFAAELATFLAGANPNLPRATVQQALATHIQLLGGAVDTYAAGDFPTTYQRMDQAYMNAVAVGSTLATAIAAQFPQRFGGQQLPTRLPNTGDGSCADGFGGDC